MRQLELIRAVLTCALFFLTASQLRAVTPNLKLVSLVPPTAQMMAGMNAPPHSGQPSSFLLITHSNTIDLNDFIALSGVDDSHFIDQLIMIASEGKEGALTEHSLLAIGRFDQSRIYRSAYTSGGANAIEYRGIPVLAVQPFARERGDFHDVRWLAVMDAKLALFGTIAMVQQELERYLNRSVVEPLLVQKLSRLRRDYDTWCVVTLPDHDSEIQSMFQILDSRLAALLRAGDTIQFGIHYGRQVEFEYEVGMGLNPNREEAGSSREWPSTGPRGSSLLPVADLTRVDGGVRGVLKVPKARYVAWITEVQKQTYQRAAAGSSRQ